MSARSKLAAVLIVLGLVPVALAAQEPGAPPAPEPARWSGAPVSLPGPSLETAGTAGLFSPGGSAAATGAARAIAVSLMPARSAASAPLLAPMFEARHSRPGVALMIVGGAGLVVGSLIGSDLVTVAGAGVGLYGLYLYLR